MSVGEGTGTGAPPGAAAGDPPAAGADGAALLFFIWIAKARCACAICFTVGAAVGMFIAFSAAAIASSYFLSWLSACASRTYVVASGVEATLIDC